MARRNFRLPKDYKETDIKYSVRDLSAYKATTLMQGLNIPIFHESLIPHDKLKIVFDTLLQSNALQTPLFGRYKLRVSAFNCPMTNYYGFMDNNSKLTADEWNQMSKWTISPAFRSLLAYNDDISVPLSSDNMRLFAFSSVLPLVGIFDDDSLEVGPLQGEFSESARNEYREIAVQPGSFLDYMGFPVRYAYVPRHADLLSLSRDVRDIGDMSQVFITSGQFEEMSINGQSGWSFDASFIFSYLDTVRTYLVNKQLAYVPYMYRQPDVDYKFSSLFGDYYVSLGSGDMTVVPMSLESIDKFFLWLRSEREPRDLFVALWEKYVSALETYSDDSIWCLDILKWLSVLKYGGLFLCQYESDMMQNLLTDISSAETFIEVQDGAITVNQLRLGNRQQRRDERITISGGRYKDIIRVLWNAKSRSGVDIPDFIDTKSFMIDPRNIVSTSGTDKNALGQMAGNVNDFKGNKRPWRVSTQDPALFLTIVSLVPDVLYSDGVDKSLLSTHFADDYSPQFDQLGFQDVPSALYSMRPFFDSSGLLTGTDVVSNRVVGKNVAWLRYLSNVGRAHGGFARGEDYDSYVLTRVYQPRAVGGENTGDVRFDTVESTPNGYVVPMDYQYPFIVQQSDFPNWFFQIDFGIRAVRAIGKNYMPTLGK